MKQLLHDFEDGGTWRTVRQLEQQIQAIVPFLTIGFLSAGQDKDGDNVFIVGGWQLWKENRVINELIPYLKAVIANPLKIGPLALDNQINL